ncbi:hypothetical protein [Enterobacter hormaechei]|uniref:hypothetical protein n=1 Tax=Enterobacter hormaechei TaxID=158836 RepID=UPI0023E46E73|nr:hypothetical protein [Enterobacter hormaechei]MDF3675411.1 hypothetical protein [Enterobacter hormaechei]
MKSKKKEQIDEKASRFRQCRAPLGMTECQCQAAVVKILIDLEVVKALLARKYSRGKGKYKGKVPLICFSCEEIGHIAARCPNKQNNEKKDRSLHCLVQLAFSHSMSFLSSSPSIIQPSVLRNITVVSEPIILPTYG